MLKIGSHVGMGSPDYLIGSVKEALSYEATTFMFYTGAPQNSIRTPLDMLHIGEFRQMLIDNNIDINDVVVHAPYLINLGNLNQEKVANSYSMLVNEINRTVSIGCKYIVLHPGASLDYDRFASFDQVASLLNKAIETNPSICILIETMSGKGSEIGKSFEEISYIINQIKHKECIGVCLDTCHIHDAGYDIANFDEVIDNFDKEIGLDYLKVIHVNDSKNERESHKDRHENLGYGFIGFDTFMKIIYNPRITNKIFILETPYIKENEKDKDSYAPYKYEIRAIRNKAFDPNLKEEVLAENKQK